MQNTQSFSNQQSLNQGTPVFLNGYSMSQFVEALKEIFEPMFNDILGKHNNVNGNRKLTTKEVCSILKISNQTLNNWVKQGKIVRHKMGAKNYYFENEIDEKLKKNKSFY